MYACQFFFFFVFFYLILHILVNNLSVMSGRSDTNEARTCSTLPLRSIRMQVVSQWKHAYSTIPCVSIVMIIFSHCYRTGGQTDIHSDYSAHLWVVQSSKLIMCHNSWRQASSLKFTANLSKTNKQIKMFDNTFQPICMHALTRLRVLRIDCSC